MRAIVESGNLAHVHQTLRMRNLITKLDAKAVTNCSLSVLTALLVRQD